MRPTDRSHITKTATKITTQLHRMKERKGIGTGLVTLGVSLKEERFPQPGNTSHWLRDQLGQIRRLRGSEKSATGGLWQAGQRNQHKWSWPPCCTPHLQTYACWRCMQQVGDEIQGTYLGKGLRLAVQREPEGCGLGHNWGYGQDRAQVCHECPIVSTCTNVCVWGGGCGPSIAASFLVC